MQDHKIIFISHIHEEEAIAQVIKKELDDCFNDHVKVFLSEIIPFGQDWQNSVSNYLKEAHLLIILFSPDSIERPWINVEAGYGIISGKEVIPIYCLGLDQDKMHYMYQRLKGIDIKKPLDVKRFLEETIAKDLLGNVVKVNTDDTVQRWVTNVSTAIRTYLNQQVITINIQRQTYFHISNEDSGRCLDVFSWSKESGASIIGYGFHGGNNQLWQLQRVDDIYFNIISRHSRMCLAVTGDPGDLHVLQNKPDGSNNQHWDLTQVSNDSYKISSRNHSQYCLSIEPDSDDPQISRLSMRLWGHGSHQKWKFKITATVTPI